MESIQTCQTEAVRLGAKPGTGAKAMTRAQTAIDEFKARAAAKAEELNPNMSGAPAPAVAPTAAPAVQTISVFATMCRHTIW